MQRVAIIGCGGSGKSTLARRIGEVAGLPVVHLDALFWKPGWVASDEGEWAALQHQLVEADAWVMDGNYGGTMDIRFERADTILLLDLPRRSCLWRVVKRRFRTGHGRRPDLAEGCFEQLDWAFMKWVWRYPKDSRPLTLARLAALPPSGPAVRILRNGRDIRAFLEQLQPRDPNQRT